MRLSSLCIAGLAAALIPCGAASAALTVDGTTMYGNVSGGLAGSSVSAAGDVNGDGIADVIVGAPMTSTTNAGPARTQNGEAFVIFGPFGPHEVISLDNPGTHGFRIIGGDWYDAKDHLGTAVAGIGDVNGDGYADVAAMATDGGAPNTNARQGYAAVIYGGPSTANVDLKAGVGKRGYLTYLPPSYYQRLYLSVSPAGDINGDGLTDFMFSDPQYYDDQDGLCTHCSNGEVYVEFGSATSPGTLNATALNTAGYRIEGSGHLADLGVGLAPAGDINGDGIADLLLGEPQCVPNVQSPCGGGVAYVLYGSKATPSMLQMPPTGAAGFRVIAPPVAGGLGTSVAAPGDVNGDGRPDLLLGMPFGNSKAGWAYVFFTPAHPPLVNDLSAPGASAARIDGGGADGLGTVVVPAGDVDGDGFADVAIASPNAGKNQRGSVYVLRNLHGPQELNLGLGMTAQDGYELQAPTPSHMGSALSSLGDLDADGRNELLIGAPNGQPPTIPNGGFAYVQFAAPLPSVVTGAAQNVGMTAATVPASVTASAQSTSATVQYGTTAPLTSQTAAVDAGAGTGPAAVQIPLADLQPATTYSYRVVATNASGTTYGRTKTLTTAAAGAPGGGPVTTPPPGTTADTVGPVASIVAKRCRGTRAHCRSVRSRRAAWRTLSGRVTDAAPSSGIARVEVSAVARKGKRCSALRVKGFVRVACAAKPRYVAATLRGSRWSITLRKLPRGTIRISVRARDVAGNLQRKPARRTLHLTR